MKKSLFFLFFICLFACEEADKRNNEKITLLVAAAANIRSPIETIVDSFERNNEKINIKLIISSSGKHTAQIEQGAPFDVFLSANLKYPEVLFDKGFALERPGIYAYGALVLWSNYDYDLSNPKQVFQQKEVRKIAIANPRSAPYGVESVNYLKNEGLLNIVEHKIVYGESISQTNQYILSKACEVGLTAKSIVYDPKLKNIGNWVELDRQSYAPIAQGVIITQSGAKNNLEACQIFYNFLFSEKAQKVFTDYGYELP